jgi:hypothetical protein
MAPERGKWDQMWFVNILIHAATNFATSDNTAQVVANLDPGGADMPRGRSEPIRLKFIRSTIDPRSILVDEELNPHGFDEIYDWAKRKIDFVVIDADTGEDITRILLAQN